MAFHAAAAGDSDPLTTPESFNLSLDSVHGFGSGSGDGNLTTSQDSTGISLGFGTRNLRQSGVSEHLARQGSFRPDRFTVAASSTNVSPVLSLRGTSVKQVVRNALKLRFVWNWERGQTTIQFTKGSLQTIGILDDLVYRDDVVRLKQTYQFGRWQTRWGLALGRFDQPGDADTWREETITGNFGLSGRVLKAGLQADLMVRHRRRTHEGVSDLDVSTGWKLVTSLNLSPYLWEADAGRAPSLSLTMGAFGNDPDAVGIETYRSTVDYQVGIRFAQRF